MEECKETSSTRTEPPLGGTTAPSSTSPKKTKRKATLIARDAYFIRNCLVLLYTKQAKFKDLPKMKGLNKKLLEETVAKMPKGLKEDHQYMQVRPV